MLNGLRSASTNYEIAKRDEVELPLQYFRKFFGDDLLDFMVDMTNLYSVQERGKSIDVSRKELEVFLPT